MAYQAGDTILDDEYNTFVTGNAAGTGDNAVNNVNTLWGAGTLDKGYGETGSTLASVSAGSTITATQWDNFLSRIETIAAHQGSTVTAYSTLSAGNTIEALATVATDLATITTNRLNAAGSGATVTTDGAISRTSTWSGSIDATHRITFASANAFRYFFNAGGLVKFTFSLSGGTSDGKYDEWVDLCTQMGTVYFSGSASHTVNGQALTGTTQVGGSAGGAGSSVSSIDAFALTTSAQQIMIKYADTAPYTTNYIQINATASAAAGSATYIDFTITANDAAADTGNPTYPAPGTDPAALDIINGTFTSTMNYILPSATYLTSSAWGSPTMSNQNGYE
jgi:hypothetical protein